MQANQEWTNWVSNPFAAIYLAAEANHIERDAVDRALLEVGQWDHIDPSTFLDDLLQEVAGATNIVVMYDTTENSFRASLDRPKN